ncbi:UNVERIFIED_CONTAM: hypothetical protein RMT77_004147 [Armadillidium vulgare]
MILGGIGILFFLISKGFGKNYCETNKNHVLCNQEKSQTNLDDNTCHKNQKRFLLSKEDEVAILKSVNFYREKVAKGKIPKGIGFYLASPSANMLKMKWDEELALLATKISSLCKPYQHCEGCLDLERFPSSFVQSYSVINGGRSIPYEWKSYIDQLIIDSRNTSKGHIKEASDLITWAENYLVGCGLSIFSFEGKIVHNFVCAFGPVVPDDNEEPSVLGLPCSYCPIGSRCKSDLDVLCDCETLCFPFKYITLKRMRRQDATASPGSPGSAAHGSGSGEAGASGEGEGGKKNESEGDKAATGSGGSGDKMEDTKTEAAGGTGGATRPAAGGGDKQKEEGATDGGGDGTEAPAGGDQAAVTEAASTAVLPISIGFITQLLYAICVSKILK